MTGQPVKLGLMPPLTGLVGIYGEEIERAAHIACEEINEAGGVLGRPLEIVVEDDGSLPDSAVLAANKLLDQHKCVAMIGNLLSNSRISVAYSVAEPRKIPYLNFSFYEGSIYSRYFFHFAALPNQQIDHMIPYMLSEYGSNMFFAGNNYEWPRGSIHAAKCALIQNGGQVVGEEYTPIGVAIEQIDALLDLVQKASPDVFVPYFAGMDQVNLLTRFTERGMKNGIAVVMGHYDELMASKLPAHVRDGFFSSNTYFMTVNTQANQTFLKRLAEWPGVTGIWPKGNGILTNFGEGTYVCVKAFAQAANVSQSLEAEDLVDALSTITLGSLQGDLKMDPVTHHASVNSYLTRCDESGVFHMVKSFGVSAPIIPERYRHQQASSGQNTLEDSIRLQARMLEQMSEAVILIGLNGQVVHYTNAAACSLFGKNQDGVVGHSLFSLIHNLDEATQQRFKDILAEMAHQGNWVGELPIKNVHGELVWCSTSISRFTHPSQGELLLATFNDISQRKMIEEELIASQETLEHAQSIAHIGSWDWDIISGELYWSDEIYRIFGLQPQQFGATYEAFLHYIHPEDQLKVIEAVNACVKDKNMDYVVEHRVVHPDGTIRIVNERGKVYRDRQGDPVRMIGTIQDITEKKQAEEEIKKLNEDLENRVRQRTLELQASNSKLKQSLDQLKEAQAQLVQSEKMASLGGLVAGVAHEINTPVGVGVTAISHLQSKLENYLAQYSSGTLTRNDFESFAKVATDTTQIVHQNLARAAELIRSFKQVAADQTTNDNRNINLKRYLGEIIQSLKPNLKKGHHIVEIDCADDIEININPGALSQLITNLVVNSVIHGFHDKEGGLISIDIREDNGEYLSMVYRDDGAGMSKESVKKIFDPFYTTRRGSGGTGLGMHIVYNIVSQTLGGSIVCESEEGVGSTFDIKIKKDYDAHQPVAAVL